MKFWKKLHILQFMIFILGGVFLFIRNVDGHGVVQTIDLKALNFFIWFIIYMFILAIELGIYSLIKKTKK